MSNISAPLEIAGQELFVDSATQIHELGQLAHTRDGRKFRYCKVGATSLVAGSLYQAPAQLANHQNLAPSAAIAAAATTLTVTLGGTALTANQYAGGFAVITVTPGVGYTYKILSNPAQTDGSGVGTLYLEDPIQVALTVAASKIDLVPNPYLDVIISVGGTNTGKIVGVAFDIVTNAQFGWLQTGGPCCVLGDAGTIVVGNELSASNATAGAVENEVAGQPNVGQAMTGIAANERGCVWLTLD